MANINKDIERLSKIFDGTLNEKWDTIFSKSTEDLNGVLNHIDVKDKEIYSVLSSSDIMFYLYLNGAKSIDTFDINPLTYRYYFLRKWLLERGLMDAKNLRIDEISDIIENHSKTNNIDEIESQCFWQYFLDIRRKQWEFDERFFNFYTAYLFENPQTEFDFPYSSNDIKALSYKLNSLKLSFDNIDILDFLRNLNLY